MSRPASRNPLKHLSVAEIRGIAQLATEATKGVTDIVEGVHQSVRNPLRVSSRNAERRTRGITGLVYRSIHSVTSLVGKVLDRVLAWIQPRLESGKEARPESAGRGTVLAALNGVMGDRLVEGNNPLATPMTLRYQGEPLNGQALPPMPEATGKVLLMIHGLCMNDLQWQAQHEGHTVNHGDVLASELGYAPVYLRYNSGLHVSENGRELSAQLEHLVSDWPAEIEELSVVAHSMGGLLIRSAFHYARLEALHWPNLLKNIVFLGTPHHGAPLERAGNWVDVLLKRTRYTASFAKLGQLRSVGITDLRYGNVLDEDWGNQDRFVSQPDSRQVVPLPEGVTCFAVAATVAARRNLLADRLTGDGLVPLNSALGQHDDPQRNVLFPEEAQWIAYQTNHVALLSNPDVAQQMVQWLRPAVLE